MTIRHHSDDPQSLQLPEDGRQSEAAAAIARGVTRLFKVHGIACVSEVSLKNGRRADVVGLEKNGDILIVEIKSGVEDFRADNKWPEYLDFCDRFYFAVDREFPCDLLPETTGLIIADRFGGEFVRSSPEDRMAAARRKAVTLLLARTAAMRLARAADPELSTFISPSEK